MRNPGKNIEKKSIHSDSPEAIFLLKAKRVFFIIVLRQWI